MVNSQQVTSLPFYEDGDAIQLALWNVSRALLARYIDPKDAGRLLYALQIASTNLKHTRLKPYWKEVVRIDPADIALEIKRLAEKKAAGSEPPENLKQGDIAAV